MKKSNYFYLISIFFVFAILIFSAGINKNLLAADCPIETIGLSRDTYDDLKNDPAIIKEVKELQKIFSKIPNIGWQSNYQITGNFGFGTEGLLRRFQKAYGLNNTGVIDEATRDKLCEIWAYQNRQQTSTGGTGGGAGGGTGGGTQYQQSTGGAGGGDGGTQYQQSTGGAGGDALTSCVHKVCAEPGFCKDKSNWCCIYYQEINWKPGDPCVDKCDSDNYCIESIKSRNEAIEDPRFAYDYKECYRYKCDNNTYQCQKVFDIYVKKDEKCPAEINPSLNKCTPPDIGCKKTDVKKCVRGKCYLSAPQEKYKYECGTQTLNVSLDEPCPASECQYQIGDRIINNPMSQDCERLYGAWKDLGMGPYCYVGKCDPTTHKCNIEKVYLNPGETCDDYTSECSSDKDCLPKPKSDYYFDLTACECKEDSTKGKLTLSECELKKAEAIQKQEGGCKNYKPSEDWLKNVDCSLGNYSGSQPEFECGQKLGCKWCPECIYESTVGGEHNLPRGDQTLGRGMYTGYPGGKCIKINESCTGVWTKGRCGAQCSVPQGKTVSDKNPVECTTGSHWGDKWAWNNCDDPSTCEAVCLLGRCEYTDKGFREGCALAKTQTGCSQMPSCAWVYECRGQQLDGPYRPTWYYVGNLTINTCVPASWMNMSAYTYKCVKGKCGAECDDDSDCGSGNRCNLYCRCVNEGDCIGDSDLGDPLVYGECRNGFVKKPDDYIWKDSCNGPKILTEATLTDKTNCSCGHQTFDCSKILVNGICKDGKCVSSTAGEKTYCGCKDFQKICKTKAEGGGNIGEEIECRPGDTSNCPNCKKSCYWSKCEEKNPNDFRCHNYYQEISKEKQCPQDDPSCKDHVENKKCTLPKCKDFGQEYSCLLTNKCKEGSDAGKTSDCKEEGKTCCIEKSAVVSKCSDYGEGYDCRLKSVCDESTIKSEFKCADSNKVCCKLKTTTPSAYSKCESISYSIGGVIYRTWGCKSTSDPTKDDKCVGLTSQELEKFCTEKYGPPPKKCSDYGTNYSCVSKSEENTKCEVNTKKTDASDCSSSEVCCKLKTIPTGCKDNKPKISVEKTYCDYSNCPNLSFNYQTIVAFIRSIIAGSAPPVQTGTCVKTGQYIEVCPEKANEVHQCGTNTDCLCPTGGETCSSKYPGYKCVLRANENCEPGTSKGSILDCQPDQVCCKPQVGCMILGKVCLPESQCQPDSIESLQHGCDSGLKCCKEKAAGTGEWCESCSNLSYCTRVKWFDRDDGGCDDDWYNQRTTWADDSCESYYPCPSGQHCKNGSCVTTGTTAKCSDYSGYECLNSSECESGTSKGTLNCTGGKVCCKKKTTNNSVISCGRCSNTEPCQRTTWYVPPNTCHSDDPDKCCQEDPVALGLQIAYTADDTCPTKGGKACPSGQYCKNGQCVATISCPSGYTYNSSTGQCLKDCARCSTSNPCQWTWWRVEYPHSCNEDPLTLGITPNYRADDTCPTNGGKACPSGQKCDNGRCVGTGL